MNKIRLFIIVVALLVVAACSQQTINEQHKQYVLNKGWEIAASSEVKMYTLDFPDEMLRNYEASRITFLREHVGKEVTQYSYELKEKDREGKRLKAVILEVEGEVIGGYGIIPSWAPGLFNLEDKERLINEQILKQ